MNLDLGLICHLLHVVGIFGRLIQLTHNILVMSIAMDVFAPIL